VSDDLKERLRAQGREAFSQHYSLGMFKLCDEAAERIEALEAQIQEDTVRLDQDAAIMEKATARIAELREHAVRYANDYGYNVADDLNKAAARIATLEAECSRWADGSIKQDTRIAALETAIRTALAECRGLEVYRILDRALAEGQDK